MIVSKKVNGEAKKPVDAKALFKTALLYDKQGNCEQARCLYGRAVELDPNFAAAYNNRGVAWAEQGILTMAIPEFNKAIEIDPRDPDFYFNRGLVKLKLFQSKKNPKKITNAYLRKGMSKASADFSKASDLNPEYAHIPFTTIGMPLLKKAVARVRLYRVKSYNSQRARHAC